MSNAITVRLKELHTNLRVAPTPTEKISLHRYRKNYISALTGTSSRSITETKLQYFKKLCGIIKNSTQSNPIGFFDYELNYMCILAISKRLIADLKESNCRYPQNDARQYYSRLERHLAKVEFTKQGASELLTSAIEIQRLSNSRCSQLQQQPSIMRLIENFDNYPNGSKGPLASLKAYAGYCNSLTKIGFTHLRKKERLVQTLQSNISNIELLLSEEDTKTLAILFYSLGNLSISIKDFNVTLDKIKAIVIQSIQIDSSKSTEENSTFNSIQMLYGLAKMGLCYLQFNKKDKKTLKKHCLTSIDKLASLDPRQDTTSSKINNLSTAAFFMQIPISTKNLAPFEENFHRYSVQCKRSIQRFYVCHIAESKTLSTHQNFEFIAPDRVTTSRSQIRIASDLEEIILQINSNARVRIEQEPPILTVRDRHRTGIIPVQLIDSKLTINLKGSTHTVYVESVLDPSHYIDGKPNKALTAKSLSAIRLCESIIANKKPTKNNFLVVKAEHARESTRYPEYCLKDSAKKEYKDILSKQLELSIEGRRSERTDDRKRCKRINS